MSKEVVVVVGAASSELADEAAASALDDHAGVATLDTLGCCGWAMGMDVVGLGCMVAMVEALGTEPMWHVTDSWLSVYGMVMPMCCH